MWCVCLFSVSVMSQYNFSAAAFSQSDVYHTILVYLNTCELLLMDYMSDSAV